MKKDNTLLIVLIIIGVVFFLFVSLGLGIFFVAKTVHDNAYKDLYCNENCIKYDGETVREYDGPDNVFDSDEDIYTCNLKKEKCEEKILEKNDDVFIESYLGNVYIYYKYPYKPKVLNNPLKIDSINNIFYTDGEHEIYIFDTDHVIMAGKDYHQVTGYTEVYSIGHDRYYEFTFDYSNEFYMDTDPQTPPSTLVYDFDNKSFFGYKKGNIKDAKYININYYDNKGNVVIKEEDLKALYGTYSGKQKIYSDDKIDKILNNNQTIEIKDKVMYFSVGDSIERSSYKITEMDDDFIFINANDEIYGYDRKLNALCYFNYDDDGDDEMICFKKNN